MAYSSRPQHEKQQQQRSSHRRGSGDGDDENDDQGGGAGPLAALYKFTRPHTIRGTLLAAVVGCVRAIVDSRHELAQRALSNAAARAHLQRQSQRLSALQSARLVLTAALDWSLLPRALIGVVALLLGNAFIVGVNQIYDERIDRVNKPFLPVAAGELSARQAWALVLGAIAAGLYLVRRHFSPFIFYLYAFGTAVGALYSVPPFRWRNVPILAALSIACVRGFLLNFGVYYATREALALPFAWSPPITFLALFMTMFAGVIAVTKDLPDIEGDRQHSVRTFAGELGKRNMARMATAVLLANYLMAIVLGATTWPGAPLTWPGAPLCFRSWAMVGGHAALALTLVRRVYGRLVHQRFRSEAVREFYRGIWMLFYLEYMLFVLV